MNGAVRFPYKLYKGSAYPIINLQVKGPRGWLEIEAYVDSGASVSVLLPIEAQNLGINYAKGKVVYSTVGDGGIIPVYIHTLPIRIGGVSLPAAIGFSPRLGVEFNLLGRQDIFRCFDITFSDATRTITFISRK